MCTVLYQENAFLQSRHERGTSEGKTKPNLVLYSSACQIFTHMQITGGGGVLLECRF